MRVNQVQTTQLANRANFHAQAAPQRAAGRLPREPNNQWEDCYDDTAYLGTHRVSGFGMTPNWHDALTGSDMQGRAWPGNMNLTCNNWTSSGFGSASVGHIDRTPTTTNFQKSWNSAHMSRACSQPDLVATGGNGLFYCFAAQ